MTCKLCGKDRTLCNSHIIPEFFYEPLYDEKHRAHVHNRETGTIAYQQKGYRERLLCGGCEDDLNSRYEDYVKEVWYDQGKLPPASDFGQPAIVGLDYHRFKLCMLSILWRAAVARQEFFSRVTLGPHEEKLRQMILTDDPGDDALYPFLCAVLWLPDAKTHRPYIVRAATMQPLPKRFNHKHVYRFHFGGCQWDFLMGRDIEWGDLTIHRDGTLPIAWLNFAQLREIKQFLKDFERAERERKRRVS